MAPLMKEIGKRFQASHTGVIVIVEAGGSGRGISDVRTGKVDIGMVSRALTDKEKDLYGFPVARDGVCVIIHMNNPVKALSDSQVTGIFTGRIANWKKVGGRDAPIVVLNPAERYSSSELFTHYFGLKYSEIKAHQTVGDNPTRIRAIEENPRSICYVSIGEAERKARAGAPVKLLPVGGVAATSRNVATGNFPISRPLTLVTKNLPAGLVKEFIEFSLSSQVFDLIPAFDFVPYSD
jgi:phosphate transport system substrate-binding protein